MAQLVGRGLLLLLLALPVAAAPQSRPFTVRSFAAIRAHYTGQPLAVHLWSMSCEPCRVELTKLAELRKRRPQLQVIMISIEPFPLPAMTRELRRHGLHDVELWHATETFDERLRYSVDPQWQGDIPRTLLISRDGTVSRIQGAADIHAIETWLDRQQPDPHRSGRPVQ